APLLAARDPLSDAGLLHVPRGAGGARARAAAAPASAARGRARAPASRGLVGRRELPLREHLVGLDTLLLALEGHPAEVPEHEDLLHQLERALAHHDRAGPGDRGLETRGDVHRVAEHGDLLPLVRAAGSGP